MNYYMVTGSTILSDSTFFAYGGGQSFTGTATQRLAAYQIAQTQAGEEIGTFLTPTSFTWVTDWYPNTRIQLPHKRVSSITTVTALHEAACTCEPVEISGCAWLIDGDNGVVDLRECGGAGAVGCACAWAQGYLGRAPKQVEITYIAGIPSGLAASYAGVLQGLSIAADIALSAILDCGFDFEPMITNFSDTGYSEVREGLRHTAFGGSPRANYAAKMFEPLKWRGALRM